MISSINKPASYHSPLRKSVKFPFQPFESLISSFRLAQSTDIAGGYTFALLFPVNPFGIKHGKPYTSPPIVLCYKESAGPKLDTFFNRLSKWLVQWGHPGDHYITSAVLALIAWRSESGIPTGTIFSDLEAQFCTVDVSHFMVLPHPAPPSWVKNLSWEGFEMGQPDLTKLESRIAKAGNSWLNMLEQFGILPSSKSSLKGKAGISSPVYHGKRALDFLSSVTREVLHDDNIFDLIMTHYWAAMGEYHVKEMWKDFEEKRLLPGAFGYRFLDTEGFRSVPDLTHIAIYLNFSSNRPQGRVYCSQHRQPLQLSNLMATRSVLKEMEKRYQFAKLPASSLYPLLLSVCRSIDTAYSHALRLKTTDAFLYLVIALEQVFSEKERTTQAVSGRCAALLHRQLGITYEDTRKEITRIYNARSALVHKGEPVPPEFIMKGAALPEALSRALMHLCAMPESKEKDFYPTWLKHLDWVIAGFEAGKEPDSKTRLALGILDPEKTPLPGGCTPPSLI